MDTTERPSESRDEPPRGSRTFPPSSRRLTSPLLRCLAAHLELPTSASAEDLRQMVDGKLVAMEREPREVQVVLATSSAEPGATADSLLLQDGESVFLTVALTHGLDTDQDRAAGSAEISGERRGSGIATTPPSIASSADDGDGASERDNLLVELEQSREELNDLTATVAVEHRRLESQLEEKDTEITRLTDQIVELKRKARETWKTNCQLLVLYDEECTTKDALIADLCSKLSATDMTVKATMPHVEVPLVTPVIPSSLVVPRSVSTARRGKAPPIDPYSADSTETEFDDWLPTLERAATWNGWSGDEQLLQLAGHLRGRALQEWNLIMTEEKTTFTDATSALRARLDPGSKALASQDFRHALQRESESVSDYVMRLERLFQIAYGREGMSIETREALLYSQLHEGLTVNLMRTPAVSGAESFKQLGTAAKHEEKRLTELSRRQQYQHSPTQQKTLPDSKVANEPSTEATTSGNKMPRPPRRCYICDSTDHLANSCKQRTGEAPAKPRQNSPKAKTITCPVDPLSFLESDDDSTPGRVELVRIEDRGSKPRQATVSIQGVPASGVIDSGADITIMGPDLFKRVAAAARLKKSAFRKPDKVPYTYDHQPFPLHGKLELDISFHDVTMRTPVYIKMDARDPLLLSEGVCHQLGIISYHPSVYPPPLTPAQTAGPDQDTKVPAVRVQLVQTVRLPPLSATVTTVQLQDMVLHGPLLFESSCSEDLEFADSLVYIGDDGCCQVLVTNPTGFTQKLPKGSVVGLASEADHVPDAGTLNTVIDMGSHSRDGGGVVQEDRVDGCGVGQEDRVDGCGVVQEDRGDGGRGLVVEGQADIIRSSTIVSTISTNADHHRQTLGELLAEVGPTLKWQDKDRLRHLLLNNHQAFAVDKGERGESELIQMSIDTGDATPRQQSVRRTPFAVRQEVARQLRDMQSGGVIEPSSRPGTRPGAVRPGTRRPGAGPGTRQPGAGPGGKQRGPGQPPKWVSAVLGSTDPAATASPALSVTDCNSRSQTAHPLTLSVADGGADQTRTLPSTPQVTPDGSDPSVKCKYPLRSCAKRSGRPSGGARVM